MQTNGNGTSTEYDYDTNDPRYLLDSITHKHSTTTLAEIGYPSRDDAGNPTAMSDWTGAWSYDYDANNRLETATPPNPIPDQPAGGEYGYDWVGNRLNPPTGSNHMVYNAADQLTSWPGMHTYTYNGDGSLYQEKNAGGTSVLKSYTYTPDGLLSTASFDSKTMTNTWDTNGHRVSFTVNSTTHNFVYDLTAGIPAAIQEDGVYYIREPNGALIARKDSSNWSYYHFDQLGSTRLLTDGDGDVTDKYAYDAYGALIVHDKYTGSVNPGQPYQYVGRLGYYTCYQEPEFGLLQLGVRFYDPMTVRFTVSDPARKGLNWYAFVGGNPLMRVDPRGLDWTTYGFVWWYVFGGGKSVDLADVGLLDEYKDATKSLVHAFENMLIKQVKLAARKACMNKAGSVFTRMHYQKDAPDTHVGEEKMSNPLYVIGSHTLTRLGNCTLLADCCKRRVSYSCDTTYGFIDLFSDPLSLHHKYGFSVDIGIPYIITAFWTSSLGGDMPF